MNFRLTFSRLICSVLLSCSALVSTPLLAETYIIDPSHTYPSFEADHMGISKWRGKVNKSSGEVSVDKKVQAGTLSVVMDMTSVDFGLQAMNDHAFKEDIFDVAKHPTARYTGTLINFKDGLPTAVDGVLTLRGVSKPVILNILSMKCIEHPMHKREACGADAFATIDRSDFGIVAGQKYGFDMQVTLRIQVEAVAEEK